MMMHPQGDERGRWTATDDGARAFGDRMEDLDVDFRRVARPELVTRLLRTCLRPDHEKWSEDDVWSWTLGRRLQGLRVIARASGVPPISMLRACHRCGEMLTLDVDPELFVRDEHVTAFAWSPTPGRTFQVALPTGRDQESWRQSGDLSAQTLARRLVRTTDDDNTLPGSMPGEWIDDLAVRLAEHDPLTALELHSDCPACGADVSIELDLEAELLSLLSARQWEILRDVHRLASAYHWDESAILQLPAWRRRYYLDLIERGAA